MDRSSQIISRDSQINTRVQHQFHGLLISCLVISIEDPFDQDDFESWSLLRSMIPYSIQIVGDDLTVTNSARIRMAAERKACNSLLLKINQIGTITESLEA